MAEIKNINHVGFAVKSLDEAVTSAVETLGGKLRFRFENTELRYKGASIQLGDSIISLIQATDENSFISQFVKERGEGVQHIGLEVDGLDEFVRRLELKGIKVEKKQMKGSDFREALVGPKTGFGVVLQLMQWKQGPMGVSSEGKSRSMKKYQDVPGLRLIE